MYLIQFHPEADQELFYAYSWYNEKATGLGSEFISEFERALFLIQQSPKTWPTDEYGARKFLLHRFPYAIVYDIMDNVVIIIAIMHLKRKPGYWKNRKI